MINQIAVVIGKGSHLKFTMLFQPKFFRIAQTPLPLHYPKWDNMLAHAGKNSGEGNLCDLLVALLDFYYELIKRNPDNQNESTILQK